MKKIRIILTGILSAAIILFASIGSEQIFNLTVNAICLIGYIYLACKQFLELRRLPDRITPLRWLIFGVFLVAIFTIVPVMMYQWTILMSEPSEFLKTISTIMSPVNRLATMALIITFVNYQIKEDE